MGRNASRSVQSSGLALALAGVLTGTAAAQENTGTTSPALARHVPPPGGAAASPQPAMSASCPFEHRGTVTLTRVTVEGATKVSQTEVDDAVRPLLNTPRDLAVFCAARDRVAALFAHKGYRLTRVDIKPQEVRHGQLALLATEGYIAEVDTARLKKMGPSAAQARVFLDKLTPGAVKPPPPTPWPRIERAVLLARDVPGAEIGVRLHASPDGPGAIELDASADGRRRYDVSVGVEDMGSKQLGQVSGFARFDANSFTPYGDRESLLLYGTTTGAQKVAELLGGWFLGGSGLRSEFDITYARSEPKGEVSSLGIQGDFFDGAFGLNYPIVRSSEFNLNADAGMEIINQRNSLGALRGDAGTPLLFKDKLRVVHLRGDLRWLPEGLKPLSFTADVEARQDIAGLGASRKGDPNLSRASGDPGAFLTRADATARWTFKGRPEQGAFNGPWIEVSGHLQYSQQSLLAYEQFQIGNYTVGRGYDPGAASGDSAYGVQFETGVPIALPYTWHGQNRHIEIEPYGFYDTVRVENQVGYNTVVSSAGGGLRAWLPWKLRFDAACADPLDPPIPGTRRPGVRLLATVARVFSFQ